MGVDSQVTSWARAQFGAEAREVTRRVVRALAAAHLSGLEAQAASGMVKRFPFGSVWIARFDNLVAELHDMPGAELVPVPGAGYKLVRLNGRVLVPFRLGAALTVQPAQARIESQVLRDLTALAVPRPVPPPTLFDPPEPAAEPRPGLLESGTPIVYIGFVANAESPSLLAAWWGTGEALDPAGRLTWSPEPLPLDIVHPDDVVVGVPTPREPGRLAAFDEGEAPELPVSARATPRTADGRG